MYEAERKLSDLQKKLMELEQQTQQERTEIRRKVDYVYKQLQNLQGRDQQLLEASANITTSTNASTEIPTSTTESFKRKYDDSDSYKIGTEKHNEKIQKTSNDDLYEVDFQNPVPSTSKQCADFLYNSNQYQDESSIFLNFLNIQTDAFCKPLIDWNIF